MASDDFVQTTGTLIVFLASAKELSELLDLIKHHTADLAVDHITIEQQADDLEWFWLARIFVDVN